MFVQTVVHYILVAIIILANIATFIINNQDKKDRQARAEARAKADSGIE
jgi:large-conductance mechanosensitive channel